MPILRTRLLAAVLLAGAATFGAAVPAIAAPAPTSAIFLADDDDDGGRVPSGGIEAGLGATAFDDDDDDGRVPSGGVEAGTGGTAEGSALLPVGLAGGAALAAGGVLFARKRLSGARG